jgi:hypothetical protein
MIMRMDGGKGCEWPLFCGGFDPQSQLARRSKRLTRAAVCAAAGCALLKSVRPGPGRQTVGFNYDGSICKPKLIPPRSTQSYPIANHITPKLDIVLNFLTGVRRFNRETGMVRSTGCCLSRRDRACALLRGSASCKLPRLSRLSFDTDATQPRLQRP